MSKILKVNFPDFELAWEGINEMLANNENYIKGGDYGGVYGTEMVIYNLFVNVEKSTISDTFDFGKALGYKYKKWSKLVGNYVDLNYLDLVKSEIVAREKKKAANYNYTFHFDNSHGSGKDCLISVTFQRRINEADPIMVFHTRASEATKRLIFDFLLLQRIAEYIYGRDVKVKSILYIPFIYINVESFLIYAGYKGLDKAVYKEKGQGDYTPFQKRIINKYEEFTTRPLSEIKYKVHKRAAAQIQKDQHGEPLSKAPHLYAKDLMLVKPISISIKTQEKLNTGITIK